MWLNQLKWAVLGHIVVRIKVQSIYSLKRLWTKITSGCLILKTSENGGWPASEFKQVLVLKIPAVQPKKNESLDLNQFILLAEPQKIPVFSVKEGDNIYIFSVNLSFFCSKMIRPSKNKYYFIWGLHSFIKVLLRKRTGLSILRGRD